VTPEQAHRFETAFMPRIVESVARLVGRGVRVDIVPYENSSSPTRLRVSAARHDSADRPRRFPHDLNVVLTWDDDEIERLFQADGEARFLRYLDAIATKLDAWQGVRDVDLISRSQSEPTVLVGGLDFEA
jgi:hypothetical protein